MDQIRVGVIGSTGYTGIELVSWLIKHPKAHLNYVTSHQNAGKKLSEVYPFLSYQTDLVCQSYEKNDVLNHCDIVFVALPHGKSINVVYELISLGLKVIDLSADYRLKQIDLYPKWYGYDHTYPELLKSAQYGLCELFEAQIKESSLIANPGCYPTASLLALLPLMAEYSQINSISIDAKSGVSGAGKKCSQKTHFPEANENFMAYKVTEHQHGPEIEQTLTQFAKEPTPINFTTHLLPVNRGILSTHYIQFKSEQKKEQWLMNYETFYKNSPFVRICKDHDPELQHVRKTNYCDIGLYYNSTTQTLIVISVIDNLVKGAAGSAIQNMNIMFGFDQTLGLI